MAMTGRLVRAAGAAVVGMTQVTAMAAAVGPVVESQPAPKLGTGWWLITMFIVVVVILAVVAAVRIVRGISQRER